MRYYFVNPVLSILIGCIYFWICAVFELNSILIPILNWFRFLVDLRRDPFKAVQLKATTLNKTVNGNLWIWLGNQNWFRSVEIIRIQNSDYWKIFKFITIKQSNRVDWWQQQSMWIKKYFVKIWNVILLNSCNKGWKVF